MQLVTTSAGGVGSSLCCIIQLTARCRSNMLFSFDCIHIMATGKESKPVRALWLKPTCQYLGLTLRDIELMQKKSGFDCLVIFLNSSLN